MSSPVVAGTLHARGRGHQSSGEAQHPQSRISENPRGKGTRCDRLPEAPLAWATSTAKPSHGTRSLWPGAPRPSRLARV